MVRSTSMTKACIKNAAPRVCKFVMESSLIKLGQRHRAFTSRLRPFCLVCKPLESQNATKINIQALKNRETRSGRKLFHVTSKRKGAGCSGPGSLVYLCSATGSNKCPRPERSIMRKAGDWTKHCSSTKLTPHLREAIRRILKSSK